MSGNVQPAGTATATISSGAAGALPVSLGYYPHEGSRVIAATYNWFAQTGYYEDLSGLVAKGVETTIQSAWVDNSQNVQPVTLTLAGTGQVISIPGSTQASVPLLFTGAPALQLTVPVLAPNVGACTRISYLNVPCPGGVFPVYQGNPAMQTPAYNITASTVIKPAPGRVGRVVVNTAIATAAATLNDCTTTGAATAANTILTIPIGAAAGSIFDIEWPCQTGITAILGGTGALAISYT